MADWHTCTCQGCGAQKTMKSRAYPRRWETDTYNEQGYYILLCPDCKRAEPVRVGYGLAAPGVR